MGFYNRYITDAYQLQIKPDTGRGLLSISSLFDPLGMVTIVVLGGRLFQHPGAHAGIF